MTGKDTAPVRVLIADDHAIVRKGIRALLSEAGGFEVVGEASNGQEAVLRAAETQPDVILMDLLMPVMDGIEATRQITSQQPQARILVLTSFAADNKVFPAIKAGALGYLLKDSSPDELVRAIRQVHRGEPSLHPTIARKLLQEIATPRRVAACARGAHGARAGGAAVDRPGAEQSGNRRPDLGQRADGARPCEPDPRQTTPGQPHPGRALRGAGRVDGRGRARRKRNHSRDVLGRTCPSNTLHQKFQGPPPRAALLLG